MPDYQTSKRGEDTLKMPTKSSCRCPRDMPPPPNRAPLDPISLEIWGPRVTHIPGVRLHETIPNAEPYSCVASPILSQKW